MQICRPAMCIEAIRVALLDNCTLLPICGPLNGYAMGCIIDPNWTPEIEEGEESIVKDNCGNICLRDDRCDLTKRWNLEFKIKDPDKEFLALIEGNPLIVNGGGDSIGVRQLAYGACSPFVFLELFERTNDCDTQGEPIYFRHVFPAVRLRWIGNEREGIFRILQIEGKTRDVQTDSIGTGPFDDIPVMALVGTSSSERIDYAWFEDSFVPTVQCGAIEVPCPIVGPQPTIETDDFDPGCNQYRFMGTNLDVVDRLDVLGDFGTHTYYNPAGPNSALNNPYQITINTWTATNIRIEDLALNDQVTPHTITATHLYGVANSPDYGVFDIVDYDIPPCDNFTEPLPFNNAQSPACERFFFSGINFGFINHLRTDGSFGQVSYYDPAGPDAGLNPGTSTINSWTPTLIDITDTQQGGQTITEFHIWGVGDVPDYSFYDNFWPAPVLSVANC